MLSLVVLTFALSGLADNPVCTVEKKFFALRQQLVLTVRKKLNLLHHQFTIVSELDGRQFHTTGDYFGAKFSITSCDEEQVIAQITRKTGYTIEILHDQSDPAALIAVVIIIHLCCHLTKDE
jgi:uncharacterized protein YxjI